MLHMQLMLARSQPCFGPKKWYLRARPCNIKGMARHHDESLESYVQRLASELETARREYDDANTPAEENAADEAIKDVVEEAEVEGVLDELADETQDSAVEDELAEATGVDEQTTDDEPDTSTVVVADDAVVINNDITALEPDTAPRPDHWGEKRLSIFGKRN